MYHYIKQKKLLATKNHDGYYVVTKFNLKDFIENNFLLNYKLNEDILKRFGLSRKVLQLEEVTKIIAQLKGQISIRKASITYHIRAKHLKAEKNQLGRYIITESDCGSGWKNTLNNLRFILQPTLVMWLIFPWLDVFPNSKLLLGFNHLISLINQYQPFCSSS